MPYSACFNTAGEAIHYMLSRQHYFALAALWQLVDLISLLVPLPRRVNAWHTCLGFRLDLW